MKFVGLGNLPEPLKPLVCWTDEEYELYFELLKTRRQDLKFIANRLGKSFIEVHALTQKLEQAAAVAEPLDPAAQEFAYEVPENFDSVYEPGELPPAQSFEKMDPEANLSEIWDKTTLERWTEVCGVEWTEKVLELLTQHVHFFILEALRRCEADDLIGTLSTGELKLSRKEDLVRLGYGGATPHVFSSAEKAQIDANEQLIELVGGQVKDYNWYKLHFQDYVLDTKDSIPSPTKSGLFIKPTPQQERELEALDRETERLEELDGAATVDYIRAAAEAKGSCLSIIDRLSAQFGSCECCSPKPQKRRLGGLGDSKASKRKRGEKNPFDWIKPERLSGVNKRAMRNREREEKEQTQAVQ